MRKCVSESACAIRFGRKNGFASLTQVQQIARFLKSVWGTAVDSKMLLFPGHAFQFGRLNEEGT